MDHDEGNPQSLADRLGIERRLSRIEAANENHAAVVTAGLQHLQETVAEMISRLDVQNGRVDSLERVRLIDESKELLNKEHQEGITKRVVVLETWKSERVAQLAHAEGYQKGQRNMRRRDGVILLALYNAAIALGGLLYNILFA